jgi:multiple sugar transport system permease protein
MSSIGTPAARAEAAIAGEPAPAVGQRFGDDRLWRHLTLTPALLMFLALTVLPIVNMLAMSFSKIDWVEGQAVWTSVGLANYRELPSDNLFRAAIVNTVLFVVASVVVEIVLGFLLALMTSRIGRGRVVYRAVFLLPILIPGIVIGAIWKLMYNYDFGLINQVVGLVGLAPQDWLGQQGTALLSVIVVDIWHWTPFCFLLMLAGIESLPQEVHEAATIDGASGMQELLHITLPMMWPTILVTMAFRTIVAFKVFDEVFLLTGGGPGTATEVLSFTIYQRVFTEDRAGYGSALAIVTIFGVSLLLVLALSARRREAVR